MTHPEQGSEGGRGAVGLVQAVLQAQRGRRDVVEELRVGALVAGAAAAATVHLLTHASTPFGGSSAREMSRRNFFSRGQPRQQLRSA